MDSIASLAGVLVVVAIRMIDWKSVNLLRHRSTAFDFIVGLTVIVSAVSISLIAAAGVGIAFAIILFLRDQIRFPVVRRLSFGDVNFSKKNRPQSEHAILIEKGKETIVIELQGQLFFGTTDQYSEVEPYFSKCRFFIFDMRRILSIDFTAAKMLSQLNHKISDNNGVMIFTSVPLSLPTGLNIREYLSKLGFVKDSDSILFFDETADAIEWAEDEYIREALPEHLHGKALEIAEFDFFKSIPSSAINNLSSFMRELSIDKDGVIFKIGDSGREIFFIRKGEVKIMLPVGKDRCHHLATFTRGAFFGEYGFLG